MMYHGTLTEIYGLELAIEGFGMVHNEMPGAELWILGDGPEKGLLESLTQERGLASKVRLVGHVLPTEVPTWLDKCDIGVLPMRRDIFLEFAFPNKLSEYIIMGKAVLIPRLKAIRHYFSEEALAYFEPNNPADLAKQMVCLYRDGGLRARLAARAKEEYAPIRWDVMRQRYLRLIEDMVGPGHRTAGREASQYTYVLITPARNEAKFIELTIKSVVGQTIRPAKWVIVSDGSTDGTDDIVSKYAAEHRWIELVRMPERRERHFAGKVHAFNSGYARMTDMKYDVIGSLDGDISLEDEDYFSFLLSKFAEDPTLGLVGTPYKGRSTYDYRFVSIDYVSGACQLFRRECFEEIGGYVPVKEGGVDDIAVITARMKGWKTRTFTDKMCLHHREHGSAEHSALMARFRDGALDYALGGHPVWELFRTVYQMTKRPVVVGGLTLLAGYVWAMVRRVHRPVSRELVEFHRREQMRRLWKFLTGNRSPRNHALQHPLDGADAGGG